MLDRVSLRGAGGSDVTSTTSVCSPGESATSTRRRSPTDNVNVGISADLNPVRLNPDLIFAHWQEIKREFTSGTRLSVSTLLSADVRNRDLCVRYNRTRRVSDNTDCIGCNLLRHATSIKEAH